MSLVSKIKKIFCLFSWSWHNKNILNNFCHLGKGSLGGLEHEALGPDLSSGCIVYKKARKIMMFCFIQPEGLKKRLITSWGCSSTSDRSPTFRWSYEGSYNTVLSHPHNIWLLSVRDESRYEIYCKCALAFYPPTKWRLGRI